MSNQNDLGAMLSNLESIKNGDDPREERPSEEASSVTAPQSHPTTKTRLESDDALEVLKGEIDRLFDEHSVVRDTVLRNEIHCAVARWDGRNGYCKYHTALGGKQRFNKRLTATSRKHGHHLIAVNEKILEQGNRDEFLDTVRHELAHAVCYEIHDESQKHNHNWKAMAAKLDADPSSTHNKRDRSDEYEYYLYCSACGNEWGKTKRCKVIKQPFNRKCACGHTPLSSYDAGQEQPDEDGVVAVESLSWDDRDGWVSAGRP